MDPEALVDAVDMGKAERRWTHPQAERLTTVPDDCDCTWTIRIDCDGHQTGGSVFIAGTCAERGKRHPRTFSEVT